jgi:hypothetical protein
MMDITLMSLGVTVYDGLFEALTLNLSARFVKLGERPGTGYACGQQAAHDGHRRACIVRVRATKQPARVASKKFGVGEFGIDSAGTGC